MSGLQAFKLFDADGDGLVTTTELRSLIKKVYHMKMSINVLRFSRLAKQGIALVFWACVNENGICVNIEYVRFLNIVGNDFALKWSLLTLANHSPWRGWFCNQLILNFKWGDGMFQILQVVYSESGNYYQFWNGGEDAVVECQWVVHRLGGVWQRGRQGAWYVR